MRNIKGTHGVITVLISLMLAGILSLGTLVLEAGRLQVAKNQLSESTISAATSMIAAYDSDMYQRYGLLAIDTERFTTVRATDYMTFNSDMANGYKGNNISVMYKVRSVDLEGMYNLTYPSVLKRQILSRAKYNVIQQDYSLNYYNFDSFYQDFKNKIKYISDSLYPAASGSVSAGSDESIPAEVQAALDSMNITAASALTFEKSFFDPECTVILDSGSVALLPSTTGTVKSNILSEDIAEINDAVSDAQSLLGSNGSMLRGNGTGYSETDVYVDTSEVTSMIIKYLNKNDTDLAAQARNLAVNIGNVLNILVNKDKEGNLLLNLYVSDYFSNRNETVEGYVGPGRACGEGSGSNRAFSGACAEYIIGGYFDEKTNQQTAAKYIFAIRFVSNLYSTIDQSPHFNAYDSRNVAAHIAWAWCESAIDLALLTKYDTTVPMQKNRMILPIDDPALVESAFSNEDFVIRLETLGFFDGEKFSVSGNDQTDYKDALAMALWLVPNSHKLYRIADIIQLEMRYREQYVEKKSPTFLMSTQNTYCRIRATAGFNPILPVISSSENSLSGAELECFKYVGY